MLLSNFFKKIMGWRGRGGGGGGGLYPERLLTFCIVPLNLMFLLAVCVWILFTWAFLLPALGVQTIDVERIIHNSSI